MEDSFPLGSLLKDHVECVIQTANEGRRTKNRRAKIRASEREHYFLVAVLKCIYEFKLTSHYKPLRITRRIQRLQKEKKFKNNASNHTQKKNSESQLRNSFASSVNEMAESNSYIKESSIPTSPTDVVTESMTWKKRNASSTLSVTHPKFPEKRPRVEVPNQQHASEAPWLNHGPSIYGHPPQPNPDVCWAGPHGPFLSHNGSHPHFAGPSGGFVGAPHLSTNQFVDPIPYSIDRVAHLGRGRTWEQPDMH